MLPIYSSTFLNHYRFLSEHKISTGETRGGRNSDPHIEPSEFSTTSGDVFSTSSRCGSETSVSGTVSENILKSVASDGTEVPKSRFWVLMAVL